MIISHKHKFIFIKTRKTAGSSIERYLFNYLDDDDICTGSTIEGTPSLNTNIKDGHVSWTIISSLYPYEFKNYFKFAVERNPWDKVVSYYFYSCNKSPKRIKNGFESFVNKFAKNVIDWNLYTSNDKLVVNNIINYENLHDSFCTLPIPYNDELLTTKLKGNFRKESDYRKFYNSNSIKVVEDLFKKEIKEFNYQFN